MQFKFFDLIFSNRNSVFYIMFSLRIEFLSQKMQAFPLVHLLIIKYCFIIHCDDAHFTFRAYSSDSIDSNQLLSVSAIGNMNRK